MPVAAEQAHTNVLRASPHGATDAEQFTQQLRHRNAQIPFGFYYDAIIPANCHLSKPALARRYDFHDYETATYTLSLTYTAQRSGLLTGFKDYFIALLSQSTTLDISGDDIKGGTTSDSWKHCYLPVENPCPVRAGDPSLLPSLGYNQRTTLTPLNEATSGKEA